MNFEQADELAQKLNSILKNNLADAFVVYKVFAYWDINYSKSYNVVLLPVGLNALYNSANESEKLSFVRVSTITQLAQPTSYENFVNTFTNNVSKDSELNEYLNK